MRLQKGYEPPSQPLKHIKYEPAGMLSKALQKLSEQALEALRQPNAQHLCQPALMRRLIPAIQQFNYDAGQVSFVVEPRYVERNEWKLADQYRFINREIKILSSYTYCAEAITKAHNIKREHLEPRLTRYLQVLLSTYFYEQDKSLIAPLCQTFLQDLEGVPPRWVLKGAIRGVALEAQRFRFGKYVLRQPVAADLEVEHGIEDAAPHPLCATPPSAILEFTTCAPDHYAVRQEYATILTLLRLFRVGSVRSVALLSTPHSVIQTRGSLYSIGPAPTPYIYPLVNSDQGLLSRFIEHHISCGTALDSIVGTDSKTALICLAYKTYTLAVLGQGSGESQLLLALACLEALLLRAKERADARRRLLLTRRLSNLLSGCGLTPQSLPGLLQHAYAIRTAHRHLFEPTGMETISTAQPAQELLNYARITLIALLQAQHDASTEAILGILDDGSRSIQRLLKSTAIPL
jgi:hypothetical protein